MVKVSDKQLYKDIFTLTCELFKMTHKFSNDTKPTIARRIEDTLLTMGDLMVEAYFNESDRCSLLQDMRVQYERLQMLVNIAVKLKQISYGQQGLIARMMAGINKQMESWYKFSQKTKDEGVD